MRFQPKTAIEVASENLMAPGVYDFEVLEATDKTSKAGNDMIELKLRVYDQNGSERVVFDYLLEALAAKLRHAAEVCGLMAGYDAGTLAAEDFVGKVGKAKIGISKSKDVNYPDRNGVLDYLFAAEARQEHRRPGGGGHGRARPAELDDDIPFGPERVA